MTNQVHPHVSATIAKYGGEWRWVTLDANGYVCPENPPSRVEACGTYVNMELTTAWYSFAGLQSYYAMRKLGLLGEQLGTHGYQLVLRYGFDSATAAATYTLSASEVTALLDNVRQQEVLRLPIHKCQSFQMSLTFVGQASMGKTVRLDGLTFEVGTKVGVVRLPAAARR